MEYFTYMTQHWETMLKEDNQTRIRHFYIRSTSDEYKNEVFKLSQHYGDEIHHALLSWIYHEHETQQLFQAENWTAYRDKNLHYHEYLDYFKPLQYKQFIFQLTLDMVEDFATEESYAHFLLSYAGKKDETYPPEDCLVLPPDVIHVPKELTVSYNKKDTDSSSYESSCNKTDEEDKALWEKCLQKYPIYFDGMTKNVETMLTRPFMDNYFIIHDSFFNDLDDVDDLKPKYYDTIIKKLIHWIKHEMKEYFFEKENWKPFENYCSSRDMVIGYRKLFRYKKYYFQLAIDNLCCENFFDCTQCQDMQYHSHFVLLYRGWMDKKHKKLQPKDYNYHVLLPDNTIPDKWWEDCFDIIEWFGTQKSN